MHTINQPNINTADHIEARMAMINAAPPEAWIINDFMDDMHPATLDISKYDVNKITDIGSLVCEAAQVVVGNYWSDEAINSRVALDDQLLTQLDRLNDVPFELGYLRPDYMYDTEGNPQVCEINARFIFNGYYLATHGQALFNQLDGHNQPLPGLDDLQQTLSEHAPPTVVLKGRESGYDIHNFTHLQPDVRMAQVEDINEILADPNNRLVLELHQDEIQDNIEPIINFMLDGGQLVNDPRTLFIVHDKRMLAVITNPEIMSRYLGAEKAKRLGQILVSSYVATVDELEADEARSDKDSWLLKKDVSGKCDGLVFGDETNQQDWQDKLDSPNYVLQPKLDQLEARLWDPYWDTAYNHTICGTIPTINGRSFGPGIARAFATNPLEFYSFIQPRLSGGQ